MNSDIFSGIFCIWLTILGLSYTLIKLMDRNDLEDGIIYNIFLIIFGLCFFCIPILTVTIGINLIKLGLLK